MEPMKPMTWMASMEPMKPMEPMAPMSFPDPWWPAELGQPSSAGSQNAMRYAVFPQKRRLLIEQDGQLTTYDTAEHHISGVSQSDGGGRTLTFASQDGPVALDSLKRID
ncbi:MAG: hypothetical protein ACYDD1_03075 [Caulobacteraceae bacterium]